MIVKIESYFKNYFDLKKQTPNSSMKWGNITFTCDDVEECDYLVILDNLEADYMQKVTKINSWEVKRIDIMHLDYYQEIKL